MVTIKEIAQKAGVSIGTVDRVIHNRGVVNAQTKSRVLAVMEELDYKPNHAAQGLAVRKKKLKLGFVIPDTRRAPFFLKVREAAEKKAEELKQYGVRVEFFDLKIEENEDITTDDFIENLKNQDGLAIIGMEFAKIEKLMNMVEEMKIPVVFYNMFFEDYPFLAYVGCNYINSGKLAAGLSALAGGEDARVCIYSENVVDIASHYERLRGFREEMKERYPMMKVLDVRKISSNQIDNYISAQEMLKEFPDVNIVYVVNPADYGICEAIYRADEKHQVKIITNDLVAEQCAMIQKGIIAATVCQEPEKQGEMPLDILFRYLAFGVAPKDKIYHTDLSIHIAQNI